MAMIEITQKDYDDVEAKMRKNIDNLQENLNTIRAGRANPHVLDKSLVDYYGTPSPLNNVANIQVPEARMITLQPWEPKMLKEIERAIQASDLGINPTNDGKIIRLVFPMLTEERRKELVSRLRFTETRQRSLSATHAAISSTRCVLQIRRRSLPTIPSRNTRRRSRRSRTSSPLR